MRRKWRKNTVGRQNIQQHGHTAADLLPVYWGLDLNWTPIYIYICGLHFSVHLVNSGLRKIGIAPDLPEHKFLLKSGACVRIPHAVSVSVKYT